MITAVRNKKNGRLADIQNLPVLPEISAAIIEPRIRNAQAECGGRKSDWEVIQIDEGLWVDYNPRSTQFLNFDENGIAVLTQTEPEPEPEPEPTINDMVAKVQELDEKIARLEALIEAGNRA